MHSELVVLGGGPGGYAAAFLAADNGLDVTLVESDSRLGGTCLLRGCIPSKALLHVARVMSEVDELRADWGVDYGDARVNLEMVRGRKEKLIESLSKGLDQLSKRRKVNVIQGVGRFENSTTLRIEGDHDSIPPDGKITYDHIVVATGSRPFVPPNLAIDSERVMDSSGALRLDQVPESLLVIGGGYIGLELGTVYAHLGSQVSLVELTEDLLPGADRDLVKPLKKRFTKLVDGRVYLNTKVGSVGDAGDSVEVAFEGPERFGTQQYERVLVAVGRRPNTSELGLENTDVQMDQLGFVPCDNQQRTADPHILAIGDITGQPMLAHKASHEAKVAIEALVGEPAIFQPAAIPAVVFTDPEIAWAGLTEEQAKQDGREIKTALYPWAASGRAAALGRTEGLTKWLIDPSNDRILGCGIVGPGAGELISEAVLAIEMRCEVGDIAESIHPHPTLSETLMFASELYLGKATEIYKPRRDSSLKKQLVE